ncbi:helix-turn-helix domain-containing protein [Streptomyces marispadix]|uniref:Helix-turn-helix domain-containing protein n=1 Tax=Streptomyces marispadix TaxID=2922868 RepID=A0ABS9SXX8_9ACTN|nr:helix-turn-helix transcriptional regulator [Streptomyces marispadix]MCH6161129.1 helix-turn-helix domain-containing protein [Streptomyces marispadix]
MASLNVGNVGEFLREQRRNAKLSLRQLSDAAGVSNPYLSQIERGLRKPSAEILQQLARALRISAETLYVQAGILDERERDDLLQVPAAILADSSINEGQKQALLQIYESFRKENASAQQEESGRSGDRGRRRKHGKQTADAHGKDAEGAGAGAGTGAKALAAKGSSAKSAAAKDGSAKDAEGDGAPETAEHADDTRDTRDTKDI